MIKLPAANNSLFEPPLSVSTNWAKLVAPILDQGSPPNYKYRAPKANLVAVKIIFTVSLYDAVLGRDLKLLPSSQRAETLHFLIIHVKVTT